MALIYITDASGRQWEYPLPLQATCTIGRAPDNSIVLDDVRASRHHAHIVSGDGSFLLVDGTLVDGQIRRSSNRVLVNEVPCFEHKLKDGDLITIGASSLRFEHKALTPEPAVVDYDDTPLGRTQLLAFASDVVQSALESKSVVSSAGDELAPLRRKADILSLLYEMSNTLGSIFTLDALFEKATDILLRVTPADRVLALLRDSGAAGSSDDDLSRFKVVAMKVRDPRLAEKAKHMAIGRTITRKAMRDRAALLSQDAAADTEFNVVDSIVSQGVHSTICAPLISDTRVYGAPSADGLEPYSWFARDDLQLVTAIAAQTAIAVENVRAHERLAREEVARANYARFLPAHVVQQIVGHPDSFKLGG